MIDHDPPKDPYEPDSIQVFRLEANEHRREETWSWDVSFAAPNEGLSQDGYEATLAKALFCVSCALENAMDARREDAEKARAEILENALKLSQAGFGLPSRELP